MFLRKPRPVEETPPVVQRAGPRQIEPRLSDSRPAASPAAPAAPIPAAPPAAQAAAERPSIGRTLAVGKGISLSGVIADCETLLVEGRVEATSFEGRLLDIAPGALFKGSARSSRV